MTRTAVGGSPAETSSVPRSRELVPQNGERRATGVVRPPLRKSHYVGMPNRSMAAEHHTGS